MMQRSKKSINTLIYYVKVVPYGTSPTKPDIRQSRRIQNFDWVIPKDGIYNILGLTICLTIKSIFILDNMH